MTRRITRIAHLLLCLALAGCANTDKLTFLNYGATTPSTPPTRERLMHAPDVSDGLAINYANSIEMIMRADSTRSRITREASSTAQIGLAAFGGVGAAFDYGATTLAALGMTSAGIPELQKIFNAKARAEVYNQAADMIRDGIWEYYSHNPKPSPSEFTPNGLTLVKKVASAISLVDTALVGQLPSRKQMEQAVEEMSPQGTQKQDPTALPVNSVRHVVVQQLKPAIIDKTVTLTEGLQDRDVHVITATSGEIIRSLNLEEAQQALTSLTGDKTPDAQAKSKLFDMNNDTKITGQKATQILAAVRAAKKSEPPLPKP